MRLHLLASAYRGAVALAPGLAQGNIITMSANFTYSGTDPAGPPPWVVATFDDHGGSGSVRLTLSASGLSPGEFVSNWYLNIDPAMDVSKLDFGSPDMTGTFDAPAISTGEDSFKAGGDGHYDILLEFATRGSGSHRFIEDDSISYTITGISSLTAESFDFPSDSKSAGYAMATHIQGIGESTSGWVASGFSGVPVPEPASVALLALACAPLLRRRRR